MNGIDVEVEFERLQRDMEAMDMLLGSTDNERIKPQPSTVPTPKELQDMQAKEMTEAVDGLHKAYIEMVNMMMTKGARTPIRVPIKFGCYARKVLMIGLTDDQIKQVEATALKKTEQTLGDRGWFVVKGKKVIRRFFGLLKSEEHEFLELTPKEG